MSETSIIFSQILGTSTDINHSETLVKIFQKHCKTLITFSECFQSLSEVFGLDFLTKDHLRFAFEVSTGKIITEENEEKIIDIVRPLYRVVNL